MQRLSEMRPEERPRERLLREGAHALEAEELLALVLGTGRGSGEDALQLATRVLADLGGLDGLARADLERLCCVSGIGPVRAARIRAAFELCLRAGPFEPMGDPELADADPLALHVERLRGQVPPGERVLFGYRPDGTAPPLTLAVGEPLDGRLRPGSVLARLLAEGAGPWWLVYVRPGGEPAESEQAVARHVAQAAEIVGLDLTCVLLIGGRRAWPLGEVAP